MPHRFVILHHTGIESPHFDFMFEMDEAADELQTLRCQAWPPAIGDRWVELPPHRPAYLEYEGPVSGNRGEVRRVDWGTIDITPLQIDPVTVGLRLMGQKAVIELSAQVAPSLPDPDEWRVLTLVRIT